MITNDRGATHTRLMFPPTNDLMFKRMCTGYQSRDVIAGLITDFFQYPVRPEEIKLLNTESVTPRVFFALSKEEQIALSLSRRDVTVEIIPANVTIEMQVLKEKFFIARSLHYVSQLYLERQGTVPEAVPQPDARKYASAKPVWSLGILNHKMFDDERPFRIVELKDEETYESLTGEPFVGPPLRIGFFEIPKQLRQPPAIGDTLAANRTAWAHLFKTGFAPDNAPEYIKIAARIVHLVNTSPEESAMLTKQQEFIDDMRSALIQEGIEIGEARGETNAKRELALNFLSQGLNPEAVAFGTGLPLSEVQTIAKRANLGG